MWALGTWKAGLSDEELVNIGECGHLGTGNQKTRTTKNIEQ